MINSCMKMSFSLLVLTVVLLQLPRSGNGVSIVADNNCNIQLTATQVILSG